MRGDILRHLPVYAMRAVEYAWIASVPKRTILKLRFGEKRFAMHFKPMGQGEGARGMFMFRERYEPLLTYGHKLLGPNDVALDVGSNQGLFTAAFGAIVSRVIAVEPIPWQAERVRANIRLNRYAHARVVEAAISDNVGQAVLGLAGGDTSASIVDDWAKSKSIEVKTVTLDSLIETENLQRVDFIKLDVEGAELMALDGGQRMLREFRPVFCIEASDPKLFVDVRRRLIDAGYHMYRFNTDGALDRLDEVKGWIDNVFFLTAEHEQRHAVLIRS